MKLIGVLKKIRNVRCNVYLEYKEGNFVLYLLNNFLGVVVENYDCVKIILIELLCNR